MKVWIVYYSTGEYEDREDGVLKIFGSEKKAQAFLDEQIANLNKWGLNRNGDSSRRHDPDWRLKKSEEFGCHIDYTGARVYMVEYPVY